MEKSHLLGTLCASALLLTATSVNAASIDFAVGSAGTISYAGGTTPLVGSGISINTITPSNTGNPVNCDSCTLEFTTGNNTSGWDFDGGGSINIVGGVSVAGIAANSTLLQGTFDSANVTALTLGGFSFEIAGGGLVDTKHARLLEYFGMPLGGYEGGLAISFSMVGTPSIGNAFESDAIYGGFVTNSPVPVPAAVWLFGSGLLGLVGVARRKVDA